MGFDDLLAPAIYYANNGFPVTEVTARMWKESERTLDAISNAKSTFLIDGRAPREGEIFRNPDLAAALERIAKHGRDGFYIGATADTRGWLVATIPKRDETTERPGTTSGAAAESALCAPALVAHKATTSSRETRRLARIMVVPSR